jgi:hypothetical protein
LNALKCLAVSLVIGLALSPEQAASQPSPQPLNMMDTLNIEAKASDPTGIHAYSKDLIQMLAGVRGGGVVYADSLTDRLARAELEARQGKRKLISEADIAKAFNELMREIGASNSFVADIDTVHSNRIVFESALPAMISQKKNGSYCNPGEAVYVLELMIENVGRPLTPTPDSAPNTFAAGINPPVHVRLELFSARHSQSEVICAFNHLFNVFQI